MWGTLILWTLGEISEWSDSRSNLSSETWWLLDSSINVSEGFYKLIIDDGTGCLSEDSITITEENPPTTTVSGGGNICEDGSTVIVNFSFNGNEMPWDLTYSDGTSLFNQNGISIPVYTLVTSDAGTYFSTLVEDVNDCISELQDSVIVNTYILPVAVITPSRSKMNASIP